MFMSIQQNHSGGSEIVATVTMTVLETVNGQRH
jgi:hypothetical protein